jgi:hypothetical protein
MPPRHRLLSIVHSNAADLNDFAGLGRIVRPKKGSIDVVLSQIDNARDTHVTIAERRAQISLQLSHSV